MFALAEAGRARADHAFEVDAFVQLRIVDGELESNYYAGLRMLIDAGDVNVSDTGLFDWMATLASDRRMRFVASGLGLQLLALVFGA